MKINILIIILSCCFCNVFSQNESGLITMSKNKFYQNDKILKGSELKSVLLSNPSSVSDYNRYKQNSTISSAFILSGAVFVCAAGITSLSSSLKQVDDLSNGDINNQSSYSSGLALAGLGLACIIVSIPFSTKGKKYIQKSIDSYNSAIKGAGYQPVELKMNLSYNSIGVIMRF